MAAASLLSATNSTNSSAAEWSHEASALYYSESDDRVDDKSFKYKGVLTTDKENTLTVNLGTDILTGASPSGAAPLSTDQIITSPSGFTTRVEAENELGLVFDFDDKRVDASAVWDQSVLDDETRANVGFTVSDEEDYLHLGVSTGFSRYFDNKQKTLSVGFAYSDDTIDPSFNIPVALESINAPLGVFEESKETFDVVVGLTSILSKTTILQLNYGVSRATGYLTDPYRRISRVNSTGTEIVENLNESRPDSRVGHNLYGAVKKDFSGNVLTASARYHTDDFGIDSITLSAKYRIEFADRHSIEPQFRYYHQTAADFYAPQLNAEDPIPEFASADYRLAEFSSYSVGALYRFTNSKDQEWRVGADFYYQDPEEIPLTGAQTGLSANPGFEAVIVSLGVKF